MACVAVPKETIWHLEPHTAAKHKILDCYLDAWFPILAKYNGRIVYLDGFSGPGRYAGGEPGSPIVALQSAIAHRDRLKDVVFCFIEENSDRADHLEAEVAKLELPAKFHVTVRRGEFADRFGATMDLLEKNGLKIAPTFALIDPFGFSGLPYSLIKKLLSHPSCEVLITFMVDSVNRWLAVPDAALAAHITETFGTPNAAALAHRPDRVEALKDLYFSQLKQLARFVRYFEMRDHNDRVVYYVFFVSKSPLGHLRMKEAMWRVDPNGEFGFSDATNPAQAVLFQNPHADDLATQISAKFRGASKVPVSQIKTFVNDQTAYLPKHMGEALKQLEAGTRMAVEALKMGGAKRRAGTFPDDALVSIK
jgi:three-Cys-motif partner protein